MTATNSGQVDSQIYVVPNSATGSSTPTPIVTVGFGSAIQPVQFDLMEVSNIATTSPCNGTSNAAAVTPSSGVVAATAFTPGASASGDFIFTYVPCAENNCQFIPTSWTAGSSPAQTLLEADIAWHGGNTFPHAAETYYQARVAEFTPSITVAGDTAVPFNVVSAALLVATGGGAIPSSGIYVQRINHQTSDAFANPWKLQYSMTGNLRVWTITPEPGESNVSSITSSDTCGGSNAFTQETAAGGLSSQIWYQQNCSPNANLTLTVNFSATPSGINISPRMFDIQNANASSFDVAAGNNAASTSGSSVANQPTITCSASGELTIAIAALGTGPGLAVTSPSGAIFVLTTYTGETDSDEMENADLSGIHYSSPATSQNWTWTITNNGTGISSEAACFK